ncbi:DNA repair protein RecN [Candidatus Symbiobacter mobilis]|uniref:DNA repair protein RecN n=1 Tax=Candidatus Symbiobacter mobilis CR TaxID=946483 RepID=U5N7D5_9BURK|nr:DNA repair protein RecN [Candidatus Symbiobacter mobilis]AGX87302.1 DNA repair protein RecN [Candidatus Symbiobacter mobilis CR]
MSLKRLVLRNFVLVDALELDLAQGFSVLTGETGAGKSILVDALQWATGGRADASLIREGADRAEVAAEFDADAALETWLSDAGFHAEESLLLRRTIDRQGKSRAWINGSPATASQLRMVGERLLDIHGQHAWQSLIRPDAMAGLLDAYAQTSNADVAACWSQWKQAVEQREAARSRQDAIQRERQQLAWQVEELERLSPGANEWPELNAEHHRLAHAQSLIDAASEAVRLLDENEANAVSMLVRAADLLQQQGQIEPVFAEVGQTLHENVAQVQDGLRTLRAYLAKAELDPERLAVVDERIANWMSLARRYQHHPEELPALLERWKQELAGLEQACDLRALDAAVADTLARYHEAARTLSAERAHAAPKLATAITALLQELGMPGGCFDVALQPIETPARNGMEEVGFLVAGHVGSTPRPIQKVASGGELSRIALAIAVTTSQLGGAQTLIFDEVDTGVGGAVAQTIGRLLGKLGAERQVFAVTHLHQVAACADHHWVVSKSLHGEKTRSTVEPVEGEARVVELARMLGGARQTESTLAHARDLLGERGE